MPLFSNQTTPAYAKAFNDVVDAYAWAGSILPDEASEMMRRASLCPPLTPVLSRTEEAWGSNPLHSALMTRGGQMTCDAGENGC